MTLTQRLENGISQLNLTLSDEQVAALEHFLTSLDKWNKAFNLSGIKQLDEMVAKHVFDSLAIVPHLHGKTILDVGTGAGIPGLMIAITRPDMKVTMLDSNGKKIRFVKQMIHELKLENATAIHSRIEDCHDQFDIVTSRAFTALDNMLALCQHTVKPDGHFLCMKGPGAEEELQPIKDQIQYELIELQVPELDSERYLVKFRQLSN